MHFIYGQNQIEIQDADLDPVKTFECGQCFRWNADKCGVYTGVFGKHAARVWKENDSVFISSDKETFETVWREYFDLNRDYDKVRQAVSIDDYMKSASEYGRGIRLLRQDKWEVVCSFIISQCNNIPRIKKIVETMSESFGEEFEFEGKTLYSFPSAEKIAALELEDLAVLRCGYRAPYILNAARAVVDGSLDLEALSVMDCNIALKELGKMNGVGDKVANCIVLFGFQMFCAFPVDVWMKRALSEHYGKDFNPCSVFGEYAGFAQQYMFYYARSGEK